MKIKLEPTKSHFSFLSAFALLMISACSPVSDDEVEPIFKYTYGQYFNGLVDGVERTIAILPNSTYFRSGFGHREISNFDSCEISYSGYINKFDKTYRFTCSFVNFFEGDCSEEEANFQNLFLTGEYEYVIDGPQNEKGVWVEYWKSEDNPYRSYEEVQPASSNFKIISSESSENKISSASRRVKCLFNCTLFNEAGDSLTIQDGEFVLDLASTY